MRSNPPTRRSRRSSNGDSSLPIIPILIGVIVLGFVIGAGLSLAGRHDMPVVAVVSPSPGNASVTLAPVTPAPTERPTTPPTDTPTEKPTRSPVSLASAAASLAPALRTAAPESKPAQRPIASSAPRAGSGGAMPAAAPNVAAIGSGSPAVSQPSGGPVLPAVTSTPQRSGLQADSAFAELSAAVVRQYLEAVKRGDEDSAYAALGASPGAKGASLSEAAVIDSRTRVGRIDAHAAANDNALVSVQLQTASGPYYGQYTVHKTDTGAAVIVEHSIVKP